MKKILWVSLALLGTTAGGISLFLLQQTSTLSLNTQTTALNRLRGYKKWQQVTVRPEPMPPDTANLCISLPSGYNDPIIRKALASPNNPHTKKFFRVYVNETGKKAMLSHLPSRFPVGSVIIKEKLSSSTSKTPELLTVMIKRHPGYHKEWGDWEYMVVNGQTTKVEASRSFEHCYGCHATKKPSDYIFRDYKVAFQTKTQRNQAIN